VFLVTLVVTFDRFDSLYVSPFLIILERYRMTNLNLIESSDLESETEYYPSGEEIVPTRFDVTTQRVQRDNWTFFAKTEVEVQEKRQAIVTDQMLVYPKSTVSIVNPELVNLGRIQASVYEAIDLLKSLVDSDGQQIALGVLVERFDRFTAALETQGVEV
jgi:hypothetical protein